jgi:Raf kinase inhibitor-like YbhB/YbcL family protein
MTFSLTSPAFSHGGSIPRANTCDGEDRSPGLSWTAGPDGTKSYALIVDDPDAPDPRAPKRTYVHWLLYDIPADVMSLAEGASSRNLPNGSRELLNDFGRERYGGPCPPIGRHRYFHKLYALDVSLGDLENRTKAGLLAAMEGHVLAQAELVGTYQLRREG